jgi:hypothetical protein
MSSTAQNKTVEQIILGIEQEVFTAIRLRARR